MENDLISILIPVYNGAKYLGKCIDSILNNTYKNLEVILVNDGSADDSLKICKLYQDKDKRVKVFDKKNEGIAKTRNYALKKACGKYICFSDQDDLIPSDAYESLISNIKKNDSDVCIGSYDLYSKSKIIKHFRTDSEIVTGERLKEYIIRMTSKCRGIMYYYDDYRDYSWTVWNCIYKKGLIEKNNIEFKRFVNYEDDFLFNFDYLLNCKIISFEEKVVYYWRKNIESESNSQKYIDQLYEKRKVLIEYVIDGLNQLEGFDAKKWRNLSIVKNFSNEIVNLSNPKNKAKNKTNVHRLSNIYVEDIKNENELIFKCSYSLKSFLKTPEIINYLLCKKGLIGLAYYIDKYFYYKFIYTLFGVFKKIIYR